MNIICHNDTRFSEHFSFGAGAPMANLYDCNLAELRKKNYTAVVTGLGRLNLILKFKEVGLNYFFIDRGYILNTKAKDWLRISYNSLQMNKVREIKDWRNGISLKPVEWRKEGSTVMLCPPSKKTGEFYDFNTDLWLEDTYNKIKKYTDRDIIIREKPKLKLNRSKSLIDSFKETYCIVIYNSNAATEAIYNGIPAIVLGDAASKFVAERKIENIENLYYPDRTNWLKNIMYNQFTKDEIAEGKAIQFLKKEHGLI